MSTEKELLELAAKARGGIKFFNEAFRSMESGYREWNPLTNGKDTIDLKGRLKISTDYKDDYVWACSSPNQCVCEMYSDHGGDYIESTMYAVTRAAAEIGRAMP